jgi:hypothetical protein
MSESWKIYIMMEKCIQELEKLQNEYIQTKQEYINSKNQVTTIRRS